MITETQMVENLNAALFGHSQNKIDSIKNTDRFVHYTSAETIMKILQDAAKNTGHFWLRNASDMNDFSEIEWGKHCYHQAVIADQSVHSRFAGLVEQIETGLFASLSTSIADEFETLQANTHLISLSLHDEDEARTGLLSMWRAYGGSENVCVVFKTDALVGSQQEYELVLSPVFYADHCDYRAEFVKMLDAFEQHIQWLRQIPADIVLFNLKRALAFSINSTKHRAFREEKEWRVIHYPTIPQLRPNPPCEVVSINGKVQKIFKIPLKSQPGMNRLKASPDDLIDRIIIGSTQNYELVKDAFVKLLGEAGVVQPEGKVLPSGIPLRR